MPSFERRAVTSWIESALDLLGRSLGLQSGSGRGALRGFLRVLLTVSLAAGLSFLSRIIIQRALPAPQVGQFALLTSLFTFTASTALWGQGSAMLRVYTKAPAGSYDYHSDSIGTLRVGLVIVILLSAAAWYVYRLAPIQGAFLITTSWFLSMALWMSMLLRSHEKFVPGAAIERLPYAFMFVAAPFAVRAMDPLGSVLTLQLALVILSASAGALSVRRWVGRGSQVLTMEQRRAGAALAVHSLSLMVLTSGDVAIAALLVPPESVAVYSVVLTLMSPFDLLRTSYQTILLTEVGRRPSLSPKRALPFVIGPTGLLLALYLAFGAFALQFIYSGKYDGGKSLIPVLAAALLFQVIYSVFYSFIVVRSPARALKGFVVVELGLGALGVAWMFVATERWGIAGTALSLGTAWLTRTLVAWIFAARGSYSPAEVRAS